ncbi:CBS domain-containing protein [Roseococcus sp. SDR]|uniref:CBS domain-containing protein n=1 Tax=Roseococcus sp. SDR TaxID=2835532 RepID=UPI001BD0C24F|nr:CBS domain-containing protein [Roseococcus sp. SDR]MBS7790528.1 CBS domain-containing protein [Roseococcus sp. SDR]MBV1845842.1 CBS domain-containing protein [Roseococcus sp. SDR]
MTVGAVLNQKGAAVISVLPGSPVTEAAEIISKRRIGAVVVCDAEGTLVGILSERDVVRGLTQHGAGLLSLPVSALMTHEVEVVTAATSVDEAMEIMDAGYFRHLPVVDRNRRLCGIVSIRDLVRFRITSQQSDVESLQAYVIGRGYGLGRVA